MLKKHPLDPYYSIRYGKTAAFGLLFLTLIFFSFGCTKEIQLNVVNPAQVDTRGIQKVAVGRFEVAGMHYLSKEERNGRWTQKEFELDARQKEALSRQIRGRVINALATVPYFELVYTDDFAALENDAALQEAIAAGGFRTSEADAVINGRFWLDVVRTDGVEVDKSDLAYRQGGAKGAFFYDLEVLVYWPYKSVNGTLALELKLTRLDPTEVVAVTYDTRSYSHSIGGKPTSVTDQLEGGIQDLGRSLAVEKISTNQSQIDENNELVLPNFDQLVADLSESIAYQFVRRVSISQKEQTYPIATGGNSSAQLLIEAGAYEKAISVLTDVINQAETKNPDDLYNLGLCFEATGDFGLASVSYNDALILRPNNLLYARGIGRIDRRKRENRNLRIQLREKQ